MSIWTDRAGRRHVGVMVAGKRVHRILPKGTSAGDAKRSEAAIRSAIGRPELVIPGDPSMPEIMTHYLKAAERLRSPQTTMYHAFRIGRWLLGRRASEARAVASAIVSDLSGSYAPATINRSLGTLKRALRLSWESGRVSQDYSGHVKRLPEHNLRTTTLTLEQVAKLASHCSDQVKAAVWISVYTGMRRGEICKIKAEDIGRDEIIVHAGNTKTQKTRIVPIVAPLRPWLKFLPLAINFEGLKTGFRRAREAAKMPNVTFHDLRRSCGTLMIRAGVSLHVVSKVLGHSSTRVTEERYAHLHTDQMRDGLKKTFKLHRPITQARRKSGGR
jgi:integrase